MSRRSSPSFAIGGVSWLNHRGKPGTLGDPTPTGWRCFHCNDHFTDFVSAWRHFGSPGSTKHPLCTAESEVAS